MGYTKGKSWEKKSIAQKCTFVLPPYKRSRNNLVAKLFRMRKI
jgi:hypothetical protein